MADIATWVGIVRTDGLAVGLVIFGMGVVVWVVRWVLINVVTPVTARTLLVADAHIDFLNQNTEATRAITSSVTQVAQVQNVHGEKLDDIHDLLIVRRRGVTQQQVSAADKPAN